MRPRNASSVGDQLCATLGARVPRVLYGDWSAASGYEQGRKLAARDDVTAIFAANDQMAMGILRALHEAGREIPGDVSVVGFDDVPEAEFQMVPLTTVGIDADKAAQRILAELLRMIEGGEPPVEPVTLPSTELIIRRSSGPVRQQSTAVPRFVTDASSFNSPQCNPTGRTAMSATPFTRRKFLISTAAAASSAWFLAACSGK